MDQLLVDAYNAAMSANPVFTRNRARYEFLFASYVGGEEYRRGGYLTRYQLETQQDYALRLETTPLDNHCRSIIATYISFLFRQEPQREFNSIENEPMLESFIKDCDWEGRDINSFMKQAAIYANVFGHSWLIMSKPNVEAQTMADELAMGVRPYMNLLTPLVVTDWAWSRKLNGSYELTYLKYVEDVNGSETVIKEWTPTEIITTTVNTDKETLLDIQTDINGLGRIPAVIMYAHTSSVRGIGLSTISDLADAQRMIYNLTSEVEQAVRLGSHPSLVKTADVDAGSGAGAIIQMPENMDPALKPYVLEFSGQPIGSIYTSINSIVSSIDKMANVGSVRATENSVMSGISREVEFQLLNAKLSEQADNIELAEEQLWKLYAEYQGQTWDGEIKYPDSFAIRDTQNELDQLIKAKASLDDPAAKMAVEHEIMELLDIELGEYPGSPEGIKEDLLEAAEELQHPTTTEANRAEHIQQMIMEGYEDDDILEMHPEISAEDILAAKTALLNLNG
jgi:hypothetical protein